MASHFGAETPYKRLLTKVRIVVATLLGVIVILMIAIVAIVASFDKKQQKTAAPQAATLSAVIEPPKEQKNDVDILVAASRIEEGQTIQEFMLSKKTVPLTEVPRGSYRASDRLRLIGMHAEQMIAPNAPLTSANLTSEIRRKSFKIPPGYRAVTIEVNSRTGVEGFARPNSRVDVLWIYEQNENKRVATIVKFAKILSFAGKTNISGDKVVVAGRGATATLLVTKEDAKIIELARATGELSLSLVGEDESIRMEDPQQALSMEDLLRRVNSVDGAPEAPAFDGEFWTTDPYSGRQVRFLLNRNKWTRDEQLEKPAALEEVAEENLPAAVRAQLSQDWSGEAAQ